MPAGSPGLDRGDGPIWFDEHLFRDGGNGQLDALAHSFSMGGVWAQAHGGTQGEDGLEGLLHSVVGRSIRAVLLAGVLRKERHGMAEEVRNPAWSCTTRTVRKRTWSGSSARKRKGCGRLGRTLYGSAALHVLR